MPTTDTVRISVTPLVEELPNTLTARPFGVGYAIAAFENSTGEQIVQNFNANVLITFYYTDDDLQRRGVSEDDLSPAYFSTTTNSWTKVESFSVDKDANKVTVQINHFSIWVLASPGGQAGGGGQSEINLPINMKNTTETGAGPMVPCLYLPTILKIDLTHSAQAAKKREEGHDLHLALPAFGMARPLRRVTILTLLQSQDSLLLLNDTKPVEIPCHHRVGENGLGVGPDFPL